MKKIICMALALCMIFALCACGSSAPAAAPAATEAPAAQTTETVEAVLTAKEGVLVMGTNASFPPYEFISDEDGETIVGIDAEIAALVAEKLGLELVIEDMEFGSIITSVQTGKIDIGMAGMTVTEERLKNVNFSSTYSTGIQAIIVPEGSEIASVDDLAGHMIGVQESTTGHIYCEGDFGADSVTAFATGASAVQALLAGKVDAVVIDNQPALAYVAANDGLVILDTAYAVEDYAIAVNKDNVALLDAINAALAELTADGSIQAVLDKYIAA